MKRHFAPPLAHFRVSHLAAAVLAVAAVGCAPINGTPQTPGSQASTQEAPRHTMNPTAGEPSAAAQPQVQRQALAPALYELTYSARQNAVFAISAGGEGENAPASKVLRLDPQTLAVQAEIPLTLHGFGVTLDDENDRLYVGNAFDAAITTIDTRSNQIIKVVTLADKVKMPGFEGKIVERPPHNLRELVLDKANHRIFAPGIWTTDSGLYVYNTQTMTREKFIPGFGFGAAGATLDAQAGKVYVGNMQGQLFVIDARTLELEKIFEVAADQLLNLTFDPERKRILAVDQGGDNVDMVREKFGKLNYQKRGTGNRVVVIDPATGQIEHSIPTAEGPVALVIDEQRQRLIVTSRRSGVVSTFDLRTFEPTGSIKLTPYPNSLALDPKTGTAFVTVKNEVKESKTTAESVARIAFPAAR